MASAIDRLAWTVGRPALELEDEILSTSDVLEVRVIDPTTSVGRISLDRGVQLVESVRQLIWNGARVLYTGGRAGYRGGLSDSARAVVDALELAPPLPGSFMLDVYAPAELQLTMVEDGVPLARTSHHNTLVSTLRAIEAACAAVEVPIPENVDDLDQVIAEGVSTNLLNAIIRLDTQRPGLRIEFKGRWTYPDPLEPGTVVVETRHFRRFPELRDVIAQNDPRDDYVLMGWIRGFLADELATAEHPLSGVVTVEARVDGTTRDVRLELTGEELRAARSAAGEAYLTALGRLERIGRFWYLTAPSGVNVRGTPPA
jgi:hypothetical protein